MADILPQEALVRVFHFLPIKQRSRVACVCRAWRQAAIVDAVQVKLKEQHVPSYLHVALPSGAAQLQASHCPLMSLARSADLTWASAATGQLLESMPSLERLAFTSMSSVPNPSERVENTGLQSLKSLTNLQSLQLNICDFAPVLEAVPSAPTTLREIELHLTGENWQTNVLDKIANQLGSQAIQLRSLALRCSHAAVYATTHPLESLSKLTGLTSLRMGPNPEDIFPHSSPLGFPRLPTFLGAMLNLQHLDISVADSSAAVSLPGINFDPIRHVPDVKLSLRADTSIRAVPQLPASISRVTGLSSLTIQAFTFEDPGGWCTHALFDVGPLIMCSKLRCLDIQLGTWECEHCESFEIPGLQELSQLSSLRVTISSRFIQLGQHGPGGSSNVQEVRLALPPMKPAVEILITSSMRVVLRNSKVLARTKTPGVLAHSILLEEPLPQRKSTAAQQEPAAATAGKAAAAPDSSIDAISRHRDQNSSKDKPSNPGSTAAAATGFSSSGDSDCACAAVNTSAAAVPAQQKQQQHVRAPAHMVISALRDLWPGMEVWQYPMKLPGISSWHQVNPELLCLLADRDGMQQQLWQALISAGAAGGEPDEQKDEQRGIMLW